MLSDEDRTDLADYDRIAGNTPAFTPLPIMGGLSKPEKVFVYKSKLTSVEPVKSDGRFKNTLEWRRHLRGHIKKLHSETIL